MTPNVRIALLVVIDLFFVAGLYVLAFLSDTPKMVPILACLAMISYVSFSIFQIWTKAKG
jgi:hypothetical protein